MTDPESAVQRAREEAATMRASGAYGDGLEQLNLQADRPRSFQLLEWAMIEPDLREVRSTRRLGAPIVAVKRLLLRLLAQYHGEILAQQTRFNVNMVHELEALERRLEALERRHEGSDADRRAAR